MRFFYLVITFLLTISLISSTAHAVENKTLWKQWYTFTRDNTPFGYYVEEAELRGKDQQISVSQHWWEKAENGIEEVYIGSVAKNDSQYTPVAFFVERKRANGNYDIDGRVKNLLLTIRTKANAQTPSSQNITLGSKDILSNFLPLLIAKVHADKKAKELSYKAILEDGANGNFGPEAGASTWKAESKKWNGINCFRFENKFQNISSTWWVSAEGKTCAISIPNLGAELRMAAEAEALKFLGNK